MGNEVGVGVWDEKLVLSSIRVMWARRKARSSERLSRSWGRRGRYAGECRNGRCRRIMCWIVRRDRWMVLKRLLDRSRRRYWFLEDIFWILWVLRRLLGEGASLSHLNDHL